MAEEVSTIEIPGIKKRVPRNWLILGAVAVAVLLFVIRSRSGSESTSTASSSGDVDDDDDEITFRPAPSPLTPFPDDSAGDSSGKVAKPSSRFTSDLLKLETLDKYLAGQPTSDSAIARTFIERRLEGQDQGDASLIRQRRSRLVQKLIAQGAAADQVDENWP